MNVGSRLKQLRRKLSLSQMDFAKALEITAVSISHYENGNRKPDADLLIKLTNVYKIDMNWLLSGKGEMFLISDTSQPSNTGKGITYSQTLEITEGTTLIKLPGRKDETGWEIIIRKS